MQDSSHQPYFLIQSPPPEGELQLAFDLNYEIDLWGRIRRTVAAAREEAQATDADLETVSLSLHAELALDYIELRSADAQQRLLDDTVKAYTDALRLTRNRLAGGEAPASDVAEAQTQLDTTRVQDTDVGVMRAQYEHAIATLIGKPPAAFSLPPSPLDARPPSIPPGIPSELLQRRPDIAAAERRVAEANEQIGIARAAFYPSLNLSAFSGFLGSSAATWFSWPSLFWAIGTSLTQELFDGGRRHAQSEIALAGYDAAVASYRQTTLTAFQQVEDNLAALRILGDEAQQQREAVDAAENALRLFTNRYVGGEDTYLRSSPGRPSRLRIRATMSISCVVARKPAFGWSRLSVGDGTFLACRNSPNVVFRQGRSYLLNNDRLKPKFLRPWPATFRLPYLAMSGILPSRRRQIMESETWGEGNGRGRLSAGRWRRDQRRRAVDTASASEPISLDIMEFRLHWPKRKRSSHDKRGRKSSMKGGSAPLEVMVIGGMRKTSHFMHVLSLPFTMPSPIA